MPVNYDYIHFFPDKEIYERPGDHHLTVEETYLITRSVRKGGYLAHISVIGDARDYYVILEQDQIIVCNHGV